MVFNYFLIKRLKKLSKDRPFLAREEFVQNLMDRYEVNTIELIYDEISDYMPKLEGFSIYPEDDVIVDYQIDDEDLGDILEEIFSKQNVKFPSHEEQDQFFAQYGAALTMERLIQFVNVFAFKP